MLPTGCFLQCGMVRPLIPDSRIPCLILSFRADRDPEEQYALLSHQDIALLRDIQPNSLSALSQIVPTNTCLNSGFLQGNQNLRSAICVRPVLPVPKSPWNCLSDLKTSNAILDNLFYVSPNRELLYVTDTEHNMPTHTFEHLSCFLPGLLALGAHTLELTPHDRERHEWAAKGLAYTCWSSYADQASGLGPDEMSMRHLAGPQGKWVMLVDEWEKQGRPGGIPPGLKEYEPERNSSQRDYTWRKSAYLLRPEVSRLSCQCLFALKFIFFVTDRRELLHPLEDHWG